MKNNWIPLIKKKLFYNNKALQERELRGITQNMLKNEKV